MPIREVTEPRTIVLHGLGTAHQPPKTYGEEFRELNGDLWRRIRANAIPNLGITYAVYDEGAVFAGVELASPGDAGDVLQRREITLRRYVEWKHRGPYAGLKDAYEKLQAGIDALGLRGVFPQIERYGHWTEDERNLETDIIISVQ